MFAGLLCSFFPVHFNTPAFFVRMLMESEFQVTAHFGLYSWLLCLPFANLIIAIS